MQWPTEAPADAYAPIEGRQSHRLEIDLKEGRLVDARLDGESFWPTWFKVEFKESGEFSAKVKGVKLSTRLGDEIVFRQVS